MSADPAQGGDYTDVADDDLPPYREAARRRLRERVAAIVRVIRAPLADVLRERALVNVPPAAAARLQLVHPTWARHLSSPLFAVEHALAPRRLSGLFVHASGFLPFDGADTVPSPSLSFIPLSSHPIVLSSSNGIACCFSPGDDAYFVCNPATASWTPIPPPPRRPGARPALVVIFETNVYNFRGDYTLVCAFETSPGSGIYGFQVFTSGAGAWWVTEALVPAEGLIAASGVSAGGAAWWRTTIGTAVGYNQISGRVMLALCPGDSDRWEIGSAAGNLHCVVRSGRDVLAFRLDEPANWQEVARVAVANIVQRLEPELEEEEEAVVRDDVQLMRFQGAEMEVVAWARGRVVAYDTVTRRRREVDAPGLWLGWNAADYAVHTNTLALVAPTMLAHEPPVRLELPADVELAFS